VVIRHLRLAIAAVFAAILAAPDAYAADPRFEHVVLVGSRDRVSVVFELTGEPNDVATRRVSAAVLELDAGPVTVPARATSFMAPPGTRFVMGVSIQPGSGVTGGRLRARITLLERARSAVRVVGRRVYVDFSPDAPVPSQVEAVRPRTVETSKRPPAIQGVAAAPQPASAAVAAVEATRLPSGSEQADPETGSTEAYQASVQTAIERFDQLTPFMLSGTASPSEPVLKAIGSTLAGIQGLLASLDVPTQSRRSHDLLSSAVATAVTAVSPTFAGDRAAQAKQAVSLFQQVESGRR
jgi:hypothetical protein